ncbi:IclR family transcriptional regulator C-terminal domain-containing protein [Nocardioides marinquilinus]|uniref:IclR family transcriptional regulator C-terminal domain-containing protein n=1 Tax=Nocardioides marinquilinus TaxID=1210400 RepID=A0ABP9Q4J9_9ACTN
MAESTVARTFDILEAVAASGGASAKEIADATGLPLPTVYRLVRELLDGDYLVHIRDEKRFELGYKLHALGVSLHEQVGLSRQVRAEIAGLHHHLGVAAYLAVHRGSHIVVVHTVDSPQHPRLAPIDVGFSQAAHATALGKILLAAMDDDERLLLLDPEPMPRYGPGTITTHAELFAQLDAVRERGVAWEFGEVQAGATCAAAPVRGVAGALVGSVAISAPDARLAGERARTEVEHALREAAARVGRCYRAGARGRPSPGHLLARR